MTSLWRRLPIMVRAVLTGLLVAVVGTTPWALLVSANSKHWPAIPWSIPPTLLYLGFLWRYLRGWGWPQSTSEARRASLRANALSDELWGAALVAGGLGLVTLLFFQRVVSRMVTLPQQQASDLAQVPSVTLFFFLLTGSVVAGVVEEASFRGYMQGPIERRHGPVLAILVTGMLFGLLHFTHPEVTLVLVPYYLGAAAVYGAVTYLTNSILPAMVLHAGGNVFVGMDLLVRGQSEWQAPSTPTPLIWESGADPSFWLSVVAFLGVGTVAVWAYVALARAARSSESVAG